jgi:NAD(P)-dependent dehydrogenase (short-subunit alcohol dehydrogenase family)
MTALARFLSGRTAWVTGGATGIGLAIAAKLAGAGANVAISPPPLGATIALPAYADLPDEAQRQAAQTAIQSHDVHCLSFPVDLCDNESVSHGYERITAELGPIDILVNSAGICAQQTILEADDVTWANVLDVNLSGAYRTSKHCIDPMLARKWGRLIHIGSTAASVGFVGHAAYCASKHGLLGLSRCAALEGAEHGVTSNVISPGSVGTGMMRGGSAERIARGGGGTSVEENMRAVAEAMPQKRLITTKEIAAVALFLCREESRGLTAEDIVVSGGASW